MNSKTSGFSLVEILVGLAVVALLATLVVSISRFVIDHGRRELARSQIGALQTALEAYKVDQGAYPKQPDGAAENSTAVLIEALYPTTPDAKVYPIPLRMFDSYRPGLDETTIRAAARHLVDPFGNPYHYQYEGGADRSGVLAYDLWSQGGRNGTDPRTWIRNW